MRIKIISAKGLTDKNGLYFTCKLGDQKFKSKFGKSSDFDFLITPSLLDSFIILRIHVKGIFKSELIGEIHFPVFKLLTFCNSFNSLYAGSKDKYFSNSGQTWAVRLKMGFLDDPSKELRKLFRDFQEKWELKKIGDSLVIEDVEENVNTLIVII